MAMTYSFVKKNITNLTGVAIIVVASTLSACNESPPNVDTKIIDSASKMNSAVKVQLTELLRVYSDSSVDSTFTLYNTKSIATFVNDDYKPIFTNKKSFTPAAFQLKTFIDSTCKYYGLFPKAYHQSKINELHQMLSQGENNNAEEWAKAELYMTDAFFQVAKHLKYGRLYKDTSALYLDTVLTNDFLIPSINSFKENPEKIDSVFALLEPKFHDYDSLKMYLSGMLQQESVQYGKQLTKLTYSGMDSAQFVKSFINRLHEEGFAVDTLNEYDSLQLVSLIKQYEQSHSYKVDGKFSKSLIENINANSEISFSKIALSLDKFKQLHIPNNGQYVLVNIPSYLLRAYDHGNVAVESKVVVGKVASKTPVMESEISDIIVMPQWFVPPSILKLPGYIERKRRNPNYIVRGKSVIQKSGPGNALGKCKFNFKSSESVYLHDTNEKWAFGASKRAISHGCVRVQSYEDLAAFINRITPLVERNYARVKDKVKSVTSRGDTIYSYKYAVKDSITYTNGAIVEMLNQSGHHELQLAKKIPVYISYMTCAVRNGILVNYQDVYGYDATLQQKYLDPYL